LKRELGWSIQIKHGKYPMPDDDLAADMYTLAEEMLGAAGYEHYEISNWSLAVGDSNLEVGNEGSSNFQSKHNLTYWLNQRYLGFGAGAHSSFGGARYWNVLSPVEYIGRVEHGESVEGGREAIERATEMAETMILGLRLSRGVAFKDFEGRFGEDVRVKYAAQLEELERLGLIEIKRPVAIESPWSSVRLTARGRLLSNEVFWRFLP
jgi:oxygen-independent coproporphyrinogen-3 oxidase